MKEPWIWTISGVKFLLYEHSVHDIRIGDIAHSLSNLCRFNGHTKHFYSVAQHSVLASWYVPVEFKMEALLHDAAEAYIGDLVNPLKRLTDWGGDYYYLEQMIDNSIRDRFGLPPELSPEVNKIDRYLAYTEAHLLLTPGVMDQEDHLLEGEWLPFPIIPWSPEYAKKTFLSTFRYVNNGEFEREQLEDSQLPRSAEPSQGS